MKLESLVGRNIATGVYILHNSRFLKGLIRCDFWLLMINSGLIFNSGVSIVHKLIFMSHFFNFGKLIFSTPCVPTNGLWTHKNVFNSRKFLPQKCILPCKFLIDLPFSMQLVAMFLLDGLNLCGMNFCLLFPILLHLRLDTLKFKSHLGTTSFELLPQFDVLPLGF